MSDPSRQIALALCDALGIDSELVTGLTLNVDVGDTPTITVRRVILDDIENIREILTTYTLTEVGEAP